MKKLVIVIVCIIVLTSCEEQTIGNGPIVTQELVIDTFKGIETYGDDVVYISKGDVQKVEVTGHVNIIEKLERDVKDGIWEIELEDGSYKDSQLTIKIVMPMLNSIELEGSGSIAVADFTSEKNVEIKIYGSGNIELYGNIGCENLEIDIEGSGKVYALDNFENLINLDVYIDGSGEFDGFPITALNCETKLKGSGICNVTLEDKLNVRISGSGVVNYKGNPIIYTDITGSGKVNNFND